MSQEVKRTDIQVQRSALSLDLIHVRNTLMVVAIPVNLLQSICV